MAQAPWKNLGLAFLGLNLLSIKATHQETHSNIDHDIKNIRNLQTGKATGNIKGNEEPEVG